MIEITLLFAFAAMLSWGVGDFLIQVTTRKIGNVQTLAWIGVISSIGLFPFVYSTLSALTGTDIFFLVMLGLVVFVGSIINFEALKQGKISVIDVLIEIELPITILLSILIFREQLTLFQILLCSLVFFGIGLISFSSIKGWKKGLEKGAVLGILAGIFTGIINFMTAGASIRISPQMAVWAPWLVFTVICLVVISRREGFRNFFSSARKHTALIFWTGVVDTAAWVFYAFAVSKGSVSVLTAITESYPAIAMALGIWISKEKIKPHQWIGAALAIVSSVALALVY